MPRTLFLKYKQMSFFFLIYFFQVLILSRAHTAGSSCPIVLAEGHVLCLKIRKTDIWYLGVTLYLIPYLPQPVS